MVDKSGMAVSITSSVNLVFGSTVLDPDTGIILDDTVRLLKYELSFQRFELRALYLDGRFFHPRAS